MKTTFTFLMLGLCLSISLSLHAQTTSICIGGENWLSTDFPSGQVRTFWELNGNLYALAGGSVTSLYRYDGTWSLMGATPLPELSRIYSVQEYQGRLYVAGYFPSTLVSVPGANNIMVWDSATNTWSDVAGGVRAGRRTFPKINDMVVYQGKLVVAGEFDSAGVVGNLRGIAAWDGTTWDSLPNQSTLVPTRPSSNVTIKELEIWDGKLVFGGRFNFRRGQNFGSWDGNNWTGFSPLNDSFPNMGPSCEMTTFQGELVVYSQNLNGFGPDSANYFTRWGGNGWRAMGMEMDGWQSLDVNTFTTYKGQLYAGLDYNPNFPNRMDGNLVGDVARWDGTSWHPVTASDRTTYALLVYKDRLYKAGSYFSTCGAFLGQVLKLCSEEYCQPISGRVFQDDNQNCQYDTGEFGLEGQWLHISPGNQIISTSEGGNFSFFLDSGTYTITPRLTQYYDTACPPSRMIASGGDSLVDFALQGSDTFPDLRVSVSAPWARPGFTTRYTLNYYNEGTIPIQPTLHFVLDSALIYTDTALIAPDMIMGDTLIWQLDILNPSENGRLWIEAKLPPDPALLGRFLQLEALIYPTLTDVTPYDNLYQDSLKIIGAYDPNDKQVFPRGEGAIGQIPKETSSLTYKIRFQNTGNAEAFTVIVRDEIDPNLNLSSLKTINASHDYRFEVEEERLVRWTFDNILLPDSNTNEPASHGYILYTIDVLPDLPDSTLIQNTASIYFDFNPPIITNTTQSTLITEQTGSTGPTALTSSSDLLELTIFPQPASDYVNLRTTQEIRNGIFTVLDLQGRKVRQVDQLNGQTFQIRTQALPAGIYLYRMHQAHGPAASGKLIIR